MIRNYLKTILRNLLANKIYSALNVLSLLIGVVVCLLIGVWLQRELSFDNFHPNGKQLFRVANTFKSQSETFSQAPSGVALAAQLPRLLPSITSACRIFTTEDHKIKGGSNSFFESDILVVDSNFFSFFGFHLEQGQTAQVLNSSTKIVLSTRMALKYFGSTQGVVGRTLLMDDRPMTVSGIAADPPVNSQIQYGIIIPYSNLRNITLARYKIDLDEDWVGGWPLVYVQLADPSHWKIVENQINAVVAKFSEKDWKENNISYHYFLQPIRDIHLQSHLRYDTGNNGSLSNVNIFSIVGIIVLLLACINYVNLTTATAMKRNKDTSIRKVVGASRLQLIAQFFLESFLVTSIAVFLGLIIFKSLLPSFSLWIGQPYFFPLSAGNLLILLFGIIFISAISGIYPAAILSSFPPASSLKGNFFQSTRGNIVRKSLVIFQFSITIALVASIIIISQQMNYIKNKSLGFNASAVVEIAFNGDSTVLQRYPSIRKELLKDPHILKVSQQESNVVGGLGNGWTTTENLKGEEVSTSIYRLNVNPDYFDTYNMKLAAGRFFSKDFPTDSSKSVLVNESAVQIFGWKTAANAIGKSFGKGDHQKRVIGVVQNFNFESLHKPVDPLLIGYIRSANSISVKLDATHLQDAVARLSDTWKLLVPEIPLQYSFIDERIATQYGSEQKMEALFYWFSALSLVIASLGLFGLTTFVVERKIKEIGIRKVLGASIAGILVLISRDFLKLVLISILIATPLAWYFMNNWISDFAFHIQINWLVFAYAGSLALFIALFTISMQSIHAAIANPIKALKSE